MYDSRRQKKEREENFFLFFIKKLFFILESYVLLLARVKYMKKPVKVNDVLVICVVICLRLGLVRLEDSTSFGFVLSMQRIGAHDELVESH